MSAAPDGVTLRELGSIAEMKDAERFQRLVWGERDPADNADLMLAIGHEGGLVAGAFEDGSMVGFLFAFPTARADVQHSHRLGVHPGRQGVGIGARLKWYQRAWCLERDIARVRWTYDPLRRANATLNVTRLGATADTYHENYYGAMEGINAGMPSDRIVADWRLDAPGVVRRAPGQPPPDTSSVRTVAVFGTDRGSDGGGADGGVSNDGNLVTDADAGRLDGVADGGGVDDADRHVEIPPDLDGLLLRDPAAARRERLRVRAELQAAFAAGRRVVGFDPRTCRYRLGGAGTCEGDRDRPHGPRAGAASRVAVDDPREPVAAVRSDPAS